MSVDGKGARRTRQPSEILETAYSWRIGPGDIRSKTVFQVTGRESTLIAGDQGARIISAHTRGTPSAASSLITTNSRLADSKSKFERTERCRDRVAGLTL